MKNAMQFKAYIKKMAIEKNISAQLVLQNYMLERLLERISKSKYSSNIILKGGFLIGAIVGIDSRTTMDLDTTIKALNVSKENIKEIFEEIIEVDLDDEIKFNIKNVDDIREKDEYPGIRVSLEALYPPLAVPLKVDVTNGDKITPKEIEYKFKLIFDENKEITILAYNLETVLAEKLETIISRSILNTRPRDYYDVYILWKLQKENIHIGTLKLALQETAKKRETINSIESYSEILEEIEENQNMIKQWNVYKNKFNYASEIEFIDTCSAVRDILEKIF
ncbi:nucleotidyl transferase AbiEii/AbiGii toxin family protein [Clostridium sp.]|uniref:nucleotidyl transferase AbiEii/AbiGii toxin family protein n=1 Tax=Clostridium sp. TaxID=1506 RepID=UPI002625B99F|nr:nucleotidyl transferase AbiEii/AbiGii toxin family protein [Clostridium sp.]